MANTYTQLNIQIVFAVKGFENLISSHFKDDLNRYIYGIIKNSGQFPLSVNGSHDHIHAFFELKAENTISELARIIKANSSKWINDNHLVRGKFRWQEGYGAFSYSRSQRDDVIKYIINQEQHHKKVTFREEYLEFLNKFDIKYNEIYLFEWID